jgi:hypothetical protein
MSKFGAAFVTVVVIILIVLGIYWGATPEGRAKWNNWFHDVEKVDDATNYETRKQVEDSCRAMVASYEADKLTYEQYKDSESKEEQSWASQAKMRANRTAANYNNYVLKNSYVWEDNIPADIATELSIVE